MEAARRMRSNGNNNNNTVGTASQIQQQPPCTSLSCAVCERGSLFNAPASTHSLQFERPLIGPTLTLIGDTWRLLEGAYKAASSDPIRSDLSSFELVSGVVVAAVQGEQAS